MAKDSPNIYREIREIILYCKRLDGLRWRESFFNNFRMLMPFQGGQFCWKFDEQYLDMPAETGDWESQGHSRLLASQTMRQFKENIKKVIGEVGTTDKELTDAVWQNKGIEHAFKVFFPIYVKLRKLGYSEADLQR